MKNQDSHHRLPLLRLAFVMLVIWLGLSLTAPAAAQPAKDTETYKISNVFDGLPEPPCGR